ncbi:hypothetical protein [Anthocerotibacter panamensis]|uniref:hypothetical protein n=1 Tax=Anthocerotibacter panamensis TaxID=2857077 RepID=UPI001C407A38|nr:hypothetical protein [Anthocerotibacter panamensis]
MLYLVSYELEKPLDEYPEFSDFMDRHLPRARVLENTWLLTVYDPPYDLQRQMKRWLGPLDRFYIADISKALLAWSGLAREVAEFIRHNTAPVAQVRERELLIVATDPGVALGNGSAPHQALGVWQPLLGNLWQVVTDAPPETVTQCLREELGPGPPLLIVDVSLAPAAWSHLPEETGVAYTRHGIQER